jgi:hypothetical protein
MLVFHFSVNTTGDLYFLVFWKCNPITILQLWKFGIRIKKFRFTNSSKSYLCSEKYER